MFKTKTSAKETLFGELRNAFEDWNEFLFALAWRAREYPDALGYGEAFGRVVAAWRPELRP
jgi:hypothetical protein